MWQTGLYGLACSDFQCFILAVGVKAEFDHKYLQLGITSFRIHEEELLFCLLKVPLPFRVKRNCQQEY